VDQGWLLGRDEPRFDDTFASMERRFLDEDGQAWLDLARGWLRGHATLFDQLRDTVPWREESRKMYDRMVEVPRLFAVLETRPPIVEQMRLALEQHYQTGFPRVSAALYRGGNDSVAWHGDYLARTLPEALVATVSLGAPRRFLVRPAGGGRSIPMMLGLGDLLVMGGTTQRTHQHSIPKVARADPRIALMFRPVWDPSTGSGSP